MSNSIKGQTATVHGLTASELTQLAKDARKAEREAKAMALKSAQMDVITTYENLTRSISAISKMIKTDEKLREDMQAYLDKLGDQKGATIPLRAVTKKMLLDTFKAIDDRAAENRKSREAKGETFDKPIRLIMKDSKGNDRRAFNLSHIFRALKFRVNQLVNEAKK